MNRLPEEIETLIWQMSGVYRETFKPVLHQIRMRRILDELTTVTSYAHTCYIYKKCTEHYYYSNSLKMYVWGSQCCEWEDRNRDTKRAWFPLCTKKDWQERTGLRY